MASLLDLDDRLKDLFNQGVKTVGNAVSSFGQPRTAKGIGNDNRQGLAQQAYRQPIVRKSVDYVAKQPLLGMIPGSQTYSPTIGQYAQNQIIKPIQIMADKRKPFMDRAMGGVQAGFSLTPSGALFNAASGGVTGAIRSIRTGQNMRESIRQGIANPTYLAEEGLGVKNPIVAGGINLLSGNPKAALKGFKSIPKVKGLFNPQKQAMLRDDIKSASDALERIFNKTDIGYFTSGQRGKDENLIKELGKFYLSKEFVKKNEKNINAIAGELFERIRLDRTELPAMGLVGKGQAKGSNTQNMNPVRIKISQSTANQTNQSASPLQPNMPSNRPLSPSGVLSQKDTLRNIITQPAGTAKERGFIGSVRVAKNTPKPLKDMVEGVYTPITNKQTKSDAIKFINADPQQAEILALNPRNAVDVQIGNELLNYHASRGNFAKAKEIASGMANSGTELGQSIQAFSQYNRTTPAGAIKFAQQTINRYNKLHKNNPVKMDDKQVKSLFDKANKIQNMPEGRARNIASRELMEEINSFIPSTIVDKAMTVWKAGLLTSLRTQERNLFGNFVHGVAEVAKDAPGSLADRLMSAKTGKRTLVFNTQGIGSGGRKGLKTAKDVMTTGFDAEESIQKYDVRQVNWGKNPVEQALKKYTDVVFRSMSATDKPFWNAAFARSLYGQAKAQAINAKKSGDKKFIEKLVKEPTEEMLQLATNDANISTFKDKNVLGRIINSAKQQMSRNEFTKLIGEGVAPFTGVPSSIAGQLINYSPIGLAKGIVSTGRVLAGQVPELQRQAAQELGRGVIGTGIFGLGAYLASKGLITGQAKDQNEAKQWELEGKQPNSIMINGKWRSIQSVGPEAIIMLAGAKLAEETGKGDEASLGTYAAGLGKDYLGQTFLQGVQGPLQAINDPERYGATYVKNQAGSVVPNIIKDASASLDPDQRQTNDPIEALMYGIPGLRNTLEPRQNVLGETLKNEKQGLGAFFDLFNSRTPISNKVVDELSRLNLSGNNATPSKLDKTQTILGEKVKLTPEELTKFNAESGAIIKEELEKLVSSNFYQRQSDEDKKEAIDDLVSDVRKKYKNLNAIGKSGDVEITFTKGDGTVEGMDVQNQMAGMIKWVDENGNFKTVDLTQKSSSGQGIDAFDEDASPASKARQIWGAPNDQVSPEEKEAAFKELGFTSEEVRYDYISSDKFSVDEKANYIMSKDLDHDTLIERLESGRLRSVSDNVFASDGVIDKLEDEGLISDAEAKYLKKIDYNKDGTLKAGSGKGKKGANVTIKKVSPAKVSFTGTRVGSGKKLPTVKLKDGPVKIKPDSRKSIKISTPEKKISYKVVMPQKIKGLDSSIKLV